MTHVSTQVESTLQWPGMRSEYAWLAPHEGFSVTGANQIGASFTHHRGLGQAPRSRSARSGRLNMRTLDRLNDYIETHLASTITLQQLAEVARLSPFHFARSFKRSTGMTPHQFVTLHRIERAKCELLAGKRTVARIANSVQFSNLSHFRRVFRFYYGVSPAAFRG
jgi:AraC family transcriptional regulator